MRPSWFNLADMDVGNHLAQVKESMGKPSEALTVNELALAATVNAGDKAAKAEVTANIERLKKAGATSSAGNAVQTLQEKRTFHIDRPKDLKGSGTFRVQLGGAGVTDCDQVSGSDAVRPLVPKLLALKIPGAVPTGSPAKLVRDGILDCSGLFPTCDFVLMPSSGLRMEGMK